MEVIVPVVAGVLYASGIYLMLRRTLAQLIIGAGLLTNATQLVVFTSAGLTRGAPPLIPPGEWRPETRVADPLPQALVLTAIVIGFGVMAFFIVLAYLTYRRTGEDDLDELTAGDRLERASSDADDAAWLEELREDRA